MDAFRGGVHPRRKRHEFSAADGAPATAGGAGAGSGQRSELVAYLLREWAWGEMSPQQVQKIAAAVVADCPGAPADVQTLARLGTSGRHKNHIHRDLCSRVLRVGFRKVQPTAITLSGHPRVQSIVWPHELVADLYEKYPRLFADQLV